MGASNKIGNVFRATLSTFEAVLHSPYRPPHEKRKKERERERERTFGRSGSGTWKPRNA